MIDLLMRRRMMATKAKTVVEQLVDLGCKMWFPFNSTYTLNDRIAGRKVVKVGNTIRLSTSGSDKGWYYVIQGNNNSIQGNISVDWTSSDFPTGEWTTVQQSRRAPTSSYRGSSCMFVANSNLVVKCVNENGIANTANWTDDDTHTTVTVISSLGRKMYVDGTLIIDDTTAEQQPWGVSTISVGTKGSSYNNKYGYFRNVMIFNKALSTAEISQVMSLLGISW